MTYKPNVRVAFEQYSSNVRTGLECRSDNKKRLIDDKTPIKRYNFEY